MIGRAHGAAPRARLTALVLLSLCLCAQAQSAPAGLQPVPPLTARVTDLSGTLTAEQQTTLEQKLAAFEARKGSQLAVLMVSTTHPEEIEQYSIRVVDQWKLGRGSVGGKKVDDGALLLIAKDDHRIRIEVGYGLEGVLTDAMCNRIISETIAPAFREGNFYEGIDAGLGQMMKLIEGEPLPPPEHSWQSGRHGAGGSILPELLFAVLIGSVLLRAVFGRTLGSLFTGLGAGTLVWLAGYAFAAVLGAAIGGFLLTLLMSIPRGSGWSSYPRSGGFGGGWGGGFGGGFGGGGFGGGGFGGGGFSGGGGGFGGGGSSGSW
ncbi:MAG: YgcG family protein [Gammaproteobacteria bacterium]|nr:YgcG family protein [Gammaproteobacteria bacterium]MBV8975064.1 YgcG family protein [Nevskiaceae bacterium]MBV9315859.1 YgcG family protein [Gammaproteobacteria bacterium]